MKLRKSTCLYGYKSDISNICDSGAIPETRTGFAFFMYSLTASLCSYVEGHTETPMSLTVLSTLIC